MKKYSVLATGIIIFLLSCLPLHADEPRVFRVGAFNYYPAIFKDKDGAVKGFYVDALTDIGQRENIRFEYVYGTWAEGLERIKTGEADVLVSVAFTEDRAKFLDYAATPLLTVWAELYTTVGSGIDGIFQVQGKKIAVMKNDYNTKNFTNLVKSFNIACEFVEVPDSDAVLNAIASKMADAGIVNSTFGAAKHKEYGLHSTGVVFNPFDIFFAVAKDKNQALLALLESNLAAWRLQPDSPYDKARQKWMHRNDPITVIPRWVVIVMIATGISAMVAVAFVLVLKQQVKRKTISLMESAEQYKILAARQEAILTSVPDIIMEVDANKIYTWANAAGFEFFGDDVIGKQASYYFEGEQNTYKGIHLLFDKPEDVLYLESLQRRKDGKVRLLAWWRKTRVDDQGIVTGTLSTARDITEQKHAEESLRKSEERFLLAMKAANDGLFDWNLETNDIYYSPAWKKILGYEDHELPNDFSIWENTTDIKDVKKSWELQQKLISKQIDRFVLEFKMKHKDGHWVDILSRAEAFFNDKGKAVRIVGTHVDITERKQAEAALWNSEEKHRKLVSNISDVIVIIDQDGINRYKSPNIEKLFGWKPEEVVGESTWDKIHPDDIESTQKFFEEILSEPEAVGTMECRYRCKSGDYRWIEFTGSNLLHDPDINGLLGNYHDITDRKQGELALLESETRFKALHNASFGGIAIHNQGVILECNQGLSEMTGYKYSELIGMNGLMLISEKSRKKVTNNIRAGYEKPYEASGLRKNGEEFPMRLEARNVPYKGKQVRTVEFRDLTEQKQAEEEKLKAQKIAGEHEKLSLVGQVAGKIAHDFNNILGIVMGNTELALLDCLEPNTKKTLELIYEQTIRGKNLIKNLVAFAKDQEPKQEFLRISEKIELVLSLMKKDLEGIELRKEERPGVPELLADPGMIEHALVNLIQNSIHALSMVKCPRITIRTYSRDNHICFEIEDNGCGISKENLENIYEPSFTLKGSKDVTGSYKSGIKGTGYGMSNVKKYIEQHKGTISIESELGSGTKFTISLPVIKKELTKEEKTEIRTGNAHFEKYILLVEDETAIADVQYRILTQDPCHHKVDKADNGQMAKDLFDRNKYDFISLDYVLPGRLSGMDVYHHIRKTNQTVPILFVSGNIEFLESIRELKQKDAYIDHLSKPCQNKDYMNGINELLEKTLAEQ